MYKCEGRKEDLVVNITTVKSYKSVELDEVRFQVRFKKT